MYDLTLKAKFVCSANSQIHFYISMCLYISEDFTTDNPLITDTPPFFLFPKFRGRGGVFSLTEGVLLRIVLTESEKSCLCNLATQNL